MRWNLKTPPTSEPIELQTALEHCNLGGVEGCAPDVARYVQGLIAKARSFIEQAEDRQLITATWSAYMDRFGYGRQPLEIRGRLPLQSVASIHYYNGDDTRIEYDANDFQVDAVDPNMPARIRPVLGTTWPTAGDRMNAVELELICGYGDTPQTLPETAQQAMLYLVAEMYTLREPISTMRIERVESNALEVATDLLCWGDYK